ncbi:hypothetical protein ILUMI_06799, partial [Ignelater luminosus]
MLLIIVLISIASYITDCTSHNSTCFYDPNTFTDIACSNIASIGQLQDKINDTLHPYGPVEELIKVLKLGRCILSNLTINSLRFLPNLEEITVSDSNITRIAYEEVNHLPENTRSNDRTE